MALNAESLKANTELATLTPEQVTAIETLSKNDENVVIGQKIGELHGAYDADVLAVTGIQKNQGEKSYDFVKRVLGDFKGKAESANTLTGQITTLQGEIESYKTQIAAGKGNEVIAQQLKDAQKLSSELQTKYDTDKASWDTEKGPYTTEINTVKLSNELEKATAKLKFQKQYPESVQQTLLDAAINTLKSTTKQEWTEVKGKKVLVFRDKDGNIMNNPENKLNPYTATELLTKQLKDVLDMGKQGKGTGTDNPDGGEQTVELVDIATAKSQVAADDIITKHLLAKGLLRGTAEFSEQQAKIRKENEVDKLPLR